MRHSDVAGYVDRETRILCRRAANDGERKISHLSGVPSGKFVQRAGWGQTEILDEREWEASQTNAVRSLERDLEKENP